MKKIKFGGNLQAGLEFTAKYVALRLIVSEGE
jgi:hypothetical protein